jgi:8-oxo-dGTP pyrophosphatase MutT (NUDIX family)
MNLITSFKKENITDTEAKLFRKRRAVRGIVFDTDNNIALLYVKKQEYYGLPGGGVDDAETYEQAIVRECREEIGCDVEIIQYLGTTLEYRKADSVINESWGYIARTIGEKGLPILFGDEDEVEKNSVVIWVPLQEAIRLMKSATEENLYSQYCIERDLAFLEYTQTIIDINVHKVQTYRVSSK